MKKAMLMGVSGAALLFAASAHAEGYIAQGQGFEVYNSQAQDQGTGIHAGAGNGGDSYSYGGAGDGGDAGSPSNGYGSNYNRGGGSSGPGGNGGNGGMAKAKAQGGDGGMAKAKAYQDQAQDQYVVGEQTQVVKLPDIHVDNDVAVPGGGGAAGPGTGGASGSAVVEGDGNEVQTARATGNANVANMGGIAFRADTIRDVQIGDGTNVSMRNNTTLDAYNDIGSINLNTGTSTGGAATGGSQNLGQTAVNANVGRAGDATSYNGPITTGRGGDGGDGTAVSANLGLQSAKSLTKSEGGNGTALSAAKGSGSAAALGKAGSGSIAGNAAATKNLTAAKADSAASGSGSKPSYGHNGGNSQPGQSSADASAMGKALTDQNAESWAQSWAKPTARNHVNAQSAANGEGGDGGAIMSKTTNSQDQAAHAMAAGGNGGGSGAVDAVSKALGGDNAQLAASSQTLNAATGATQGGNGGDISVSFGTGAIGAINLGTVSGIATVAQNSGLSANQFTSFSINANASF